MGGEPGFAAFVAVLLLAPAAIAAAALAHAAAAEDDVSDLGVIVALAVIADRLATPSANPRVVVDGIGADDAHGLLGQVVRV